MHALSSRAAILPAPPSTRLRARAWVTIVLIGLVGQLAWTVENMYLNVFVYDTITDNPHVIATLVASSAIAATLATMLIGVASDRARTRRPFIAAGYILWGLTTAAFGLVQPAEGARRDGAGRGSGGRRHRGARLRHVVLRLRRQRCRVQRVGH